MPDPDPQQPSQEPPADTQAAAAPPASPPESQGTESHETVMLRDQLAERYPDLDLSQYGDDDDSLLAAVGDALQQAPYIPQIREAARLGQQVQPYWGEIQEFLANRGKPSSPPAEATSGQPASGPGSAYWDPPPEWNPAWEAMLTVDANGEVIARPGARPDLPAKYHEYADWQKRQQYQLLKDPAAAIWPGLDPKVQEAVKPLQERIEQLEQRISQDREQSVLQNLNQQHGSWMYQRDQNGNVMIDPQSGDAVLSARGQAFWGAVNNLMQSGIQNPEQAIQYAMQMLPNLAPPQQQQGNGSQPGQQPGETPQQRFARQGYVPSRSGSEPAGSAAPGARQNPNLSFTDDFRGRMLAAGQFNE